VAEMHDDLKLVFVLSLEGQAKLSPLHGWPDTYAAWVPRYWARVASARADRLRHQGGKRGG